MNYIKKKISKNFTENLSEEELKKSYFLYSFFKTCIATLTLFCAMIFGMCIAQSFGSKASIINAWNHHDWRLASIGIFIFLVIPSFYVFSVVIQFDSITSPFKQYLSDKPNLWKLTYIIHVSICLSLSLWWFNTIRSLLH